MLCSVFRGDALCYFCVFVASSEFNLHAYHDDLFEDKLNPHQTV